MQYAKTYSAYQMCWVPCLWSFARTKIFDFTLSRQRNQCQNSFLRYTFTVFIALFKTLFPRFIEELYRDEKTKHWVMTLPHLSLSLSLSLSMWMMLTLSSFVPIRGTAYRDYNEVCVVQNDCGFSFWLHLKIHSCWSAVHVLQHRDIHVSLQAEVVQLCVCLLNTK